MRKTLTIGSIDVTFRTDWARLKRGCSFIQKYEHKSNGTQYGVVFGFAFFWLEIENWKLEIHPVCAQCGSVSINEVRAGDEGWTVCESCQSVEQGYEYVNLRTFENAEAC